MAFAGRGARLTCRTHARRSLRKAFKFSRPVRLSHFAVFARFASHRSVSRQSRNATCARTWPARRRRGTNLRPLPRAPAASLGRDTPADAAPPRRLAAQGLRNVHRARRRRHQILVSFIWFLNFLCNFRACAKRGFVWQALVSTFGQTPILVWRNCTEFGFVSIITD